MRSQRSSKQEHPTGCVHYHGPLDVIAIKFKCCLRYWACFYCHEAGADHPAERWDASEYETLAILCTCCGAELTIREYLSCNMECPKCSAGFNPGCKEHYHLYWAVN
ncbi:MAG: hypothetical protein HYX48_08490 [Chlamydiales bacterium]|nr:hypothetical protein [Chlamydiales bacterium]